MWSWVGVLGIVAGVFFSVFWAGHSSGKKSADATWQPVYHILAEKLTKLQTDLNLANSNSRLETETKLREVVIIGKDSEIDKLKMDAEVSARVESYLNSLTVAGLQSITGEGNTGEGSSASSLPNSAGASLDRGGRSGLFTDLDRFERDTLKQIILKAQNATTLNIIHQDYLIDQEKIMKPLREKFKTPIN